MIKKTAQQKSKDCFDACARTYEGTRCGTFTRPLYKIVFDMLEQYAYKSLLDVSCGTGTLLEMVHTKKSAVQLSGIDLSDEMAAVSRERTGLYADIRTGDAEKLPYKNKQFNAVTCIASFHHYPNPLVSLMEIRRVLAKDGVLVCADMWVPFPLRQLANAAIRFGKEGDVRIYSENEITILLMQAGFRDVFWHRAAKNAYVLTAQ